MTTEQATEGTEDRFKEIMCDCINISGRDIEGLLICDLIGICPYTSKNGKELCDEYVTHCM